MAKPGPVTTFAGLISPAAEELYNRLRDTCPMAAPEFGTHGKVADELLEAGLAIRSADRFIRPVEPAAALQLLLENEHRQLVSAHTRILSGWNQLATMLPTAHPPGNQDGFSGVQLLTARDEIITQATRLYQSANRKLRGSENGEFPNHPAWNRAGTPPPTSVAGTEFQMIYQSGCLDTAAQASIVSRSAEAGVQVRLRPLIPVTMLHVDDAIALLTTDRTALLVRSPPILAMLADWFDLMWSAPDTVAFGAGCPDPTLSEVARWILTMMPFDDDESIARKLNLSVSTIRRHIKSIYQALGVDNRFAAGMAAAKLGLI